MFVLETVQSVPQAQWTSTNNLLTYWSEKEGVG